MHACWLLLFYWYKCPFWSHESRSCAPFHCDRAFKNPQVKYQILSSPPTLRVGGVYWVKVSLVGFHFYLPVNINKCFFISVEGKEPTYTVAYVHNVYKHTKPTHKGTFSKLVSVSCKESTAGASCVKHERCAEVMGEQKVKKTDKEIGAGHSDPEWRE